MKKFFFVLAILITLIVIGFFGFGAVARNQQAALFAGLQTTTLGRGNLSAVIGATGKVSANQSAYLFWQTSGTVAQVLVEPGDAVVAGELLATLEQTSLPAYALLAQAELIEAQRALDTLLNSTSQSAIASKAVEEAEQALQDALNPEAAQALALTALADAQKTLQQTQEQYEILITPPARETVDQAYANMLLAEKKLADLQEQVERVRFKAEHEPANPWLSKKMFRRILEGLEFQLTQLQIRYDETVKKYDDLIEPPDSINVMVAEAALFAAQAQVNDAEKNWERVKDGASRAEIAVLEARLADARREFERVQSGPSQDDISIAQTRIAAAEATLKSLQIVAPFDGVITQVELQPGDQIDPGVLAFRLDDLTPLLVELSVSEVDINQIQPGQPVNVTFDALALPQTSTHSAEPYHGRVIEISPVGIAVLGSVNFTVRIELLDADERVKPGMTAEAEIITSELVDVLLVPNQAVRRLNDETVVFGFGDPAEGQLPLASPAAAGPLAGLRNLARQDAPAGIVPIPITLGENSDQYSQLLSGELQVGDVIILNPPAELTQPPRLGARRIFGNANP